MASRMTVDGTTTARDGARPKRIAAPSRGATWSPRGAHLAPFAAFYAANISSSAPLAARWPTQPERPTDPAADGDREAPAAQASQPLVLVVEDEESIAETLAIIVEDSGYTPMVARNGREALDLARRYRPQLIITDLMMPYLSGAEFIAAARLEAQSAGYPFPPVVIITAASRTRAEQAGADVVIIKPFDVLHVETEIQRLIEGQAN